MVLSDKRASPALPDVVVVDTCVLMSNVVRCLLLDLARHSCITLAWSPVIGDEWRRNAARIWSVSPAAMQHQWEALQHEFPGADQGDIESFKDGLAYSDRKDWHVIAAGRAALARGTGRTVAILTRNIKDFDRSELRRLGLSLFDPDQFLVACLSRFPEQTLDLIERLPVACVATRHAGESLDVILKRERLFRLNRLCANRLMSPLIAIGG